VLIGSLLGMQAVAIYTAPYELVTRFTLLPASIMLAVFPLFSASGATNPADGPPVYGRALKHMFLLMAPITVGFVLLAPDVLAAWLGSGFAEEGAKVMRILALGLLVISLSSVPFNYLQATGRPDVSAKIHLLELPVYGLAAWLLVGRFGLTGAALAWVLRAVLDLTLLHLAAASRQGLSFERAVTDIDRRLVVAGAGLASIVAIGFIVPGSTGARLAGVTLFLGGYVVAVWLFMLDVQERLMAKQLFTGAILFRQR
jgi:O-antigen/teichoic acid export membrane protein